MCDNAEARREEIEVLQSIYDGQDWIEYCSETNVTVHLNRQRNHKVELWLREGYPCVEDLHFTTSIADSTDIWRATFDSKIHHLIEENSGQQTLFSVIELIKEEYETVEIQGHEGQAENTHANDLDGDEVDDFDYSQYELALKNYDKAKQDSGHPGNSELKVLTGPNKIIDRKSVFVAHVVRISKMEDVNAAKKAIYASSNKIPDATHNIRAYRVNIEKENAKGEKVTVLAKDYDDHGETGAGSKLLALLDMLKVDNVFVIVTRWYGGILLGPDRFRHIKNAARDCLEHYEFIQKKK